MSSNKVALVTGCSKGGIGFEVCQKLADKGFVVYATSRSLSSTEGFTHPNIKRRALDIRDDAKVASVVESVIAEAGQIDLLINNAGVFAPGPIVGYDTAAAKDVYDTNVLSIIRTCSAVVPHMAKRKSGTIVNVGSVVGQYATPWGGIYDGSKAAVRAITEVLWMECKPFNIRVMLAAPGSVQSNLLERPKDEFDLPEDSLYFPFLHNIRARLTAGNDGKAMRTEVFADKIVAAAIRTNPPHFFAAGGYLWTYWLLGSLPRTWYLSIVWNMFSKPKKPEAASK
ncbi:NAD-P-binding protein [Roridomyces roridus]|uniref:NAD-P-binding protein n=1 Tax=Roridomyces roridus TaxID=1738132 RepID=A0AAD7C3I9_9AGAR|nr:NAD-P-binding protein [Roridomyces roridus]